MGVKCLTGGRLKSAEIATARMVEEMVANKSPKVRDSLATEELRRLSLVNKMLAERGKRPKVSREEIRRMRDEGRY